jgi:polysaccharide biosynthesis transport protein
MSDHPSKHPGHPNEMTAYRPASSGQAVRPRRSDTGSSQQNVVSPQLVLYTLLRWWRVALPIGLACAMAAAAAVWVTFERQYRASVWLEISENPQFLVFGERTDSRSGHTFVSTQLELLTSPMVMYGSDDIGPEGVVDQLLHGKLEGWSGSEVPDLPPDKQRDRTYLGDWISRRVIVNRRGRNSELYTVSFKSVNPRFAKAVADGVARSYLGLINRHNTRNSLEIIELLEKANTSRVADLELDRKALGELVRNVPGGSGMRGRTTSDSHILAGVVGTQASLTTAEVQLELLKARRDAASSGRFTEASLVELAESVVGPATLPSVSARVYEHPGIQRRLEHIRELNNELERTPHGPDHPSCQRLQEEIRRQREQLQEEIIIREKAYVATLGQEYEDQKLQVELLQERYDKLLSEAQQNSYDSLELELKSLEVARKQQVIERIGDRILALRTEQDSPARVKDWFYAQEPTEPEELYPTKKLAMAASAGFAMPFALFLLWEMLARRVFSSERLEQELDLTVYGEIARMPKRRVRASVKSEDQFDHSLHLFRESFDTLSTNLRLSLDLGDVRVLAVASAVNSEGKTSVAAELARRLSENNHGKVLLIDADLRAPDIHRLFQIPSTPGLAEVLDGQVSLDQAIVTDWSEHLHLLPAGRASTSPVSLLGNGNLRTLMEQALRDYRFVVFDTAPVLAASESMILSNAADATLLCVMCEVSRQDQVRRAYRRLQLSGSRRVGLVFNGISPHQYQSRYGKYPYPSQGKA